MTARNEAALKEVSDAIVAAVDTALAVPVGISVPEDSERLTSAVMVVLGKIDIFIDNTGILERWSHVTEMRRRRQESASRARR